MKIFSDYIKTYRKEFNSVGMILVALGIVLMLFVKSDIGTDSFLFGCLLIAVSMWGDHLYKKSAENQSENRS